MGIGQLSKEAFIGVLACAREADGSFPEAERDLLNLICKNHIYTRDLASENYARLAIKVKARIAERGWEMAMAEYLSVLPQEWAYTTLLSVIDLCLIDANEDKNELACIDAVAHRFGIPAEHVDNFMQWFRVKNGMSSPTNLAQAVGQ